MLKDEAEYRSVSREVSGLNMADEDIRTCISLMEQKGAKGSTASVLCLILSVRAEGLLITSRYLPLSSSSSYGADHG